MSTTPNGESAEGVSLERELTWSSKRHRSDGQPATSKQERNYTCDDGSPINQSIVVITADGKCI